MALESPLVVEFKSLIEPIPAIQHPWFQGVINGEFTTDQIIAGERQHYLRGLYANARIFGTIAFKAIEEGDDDVSDLAVANLREEVCGPITHADLMYQFLEAHGISKQDAATSEPMPSTTRAIDMMGEGVDRFSALEGMAMMALPEFQNGGQEGTAGALHQALRVQGYSDYAIETYAVHAVADEGHGDSQLELLARKVDERPEIKPGILRAMRWGVDAFNSEWDGHYQAASGDETFQWQGVTE